MGNRAVVLFEKEVNTQGMYAGVYLHWNGGPDSVYAFLEYMKEVGVRGGDDPYARARFVQIVCNFFGGTLSVGIECYTLKDACNIGSDNGVYAVRWENGDYTVERYTGNGNPFPPGATEIERNNIQNSRYWKGTPNILDDLREKNGAFFKK